MRKGILALVTGLSLASAAVAAPQQQGNGAAIDSQSPVPGIQTVFIILMENQNWNSSVAGTFTSSNAPYIMNTIVPAAAYANNYTMVSGNQGPSEPNYKWLEGGSDFNQFTDNDPSSSNSISSTLHLTTYLNNAGISWKAYAENIDGAECPLVSSANSLSSSTTVGGGSANYYAKHDPFVFFDDLTDNLSSTSTMCIDHIRPYSELASDLANGTVARYNFIIPNGTDDMHDSGIKTGDTWLSQNVPTILNSTAYQNNGAIFIAWDESANDAGTLPFFVLSPLVKSAGYSNTIQYSHSSMLLTLQEIFGVGPCLADACNATDLSDLFLPGVIPPLPGTVVTISPTSTTLTVNQQQQFTATVTGNSDTAVTWTMSPSNAGSISSSGLFTAPGTISTAQTVNVIATSHADTTKSATATVSLQPAQGTQSQTITFGALSNEVFGTAPFTVSATASSGLTVSFASTTPPVCTVSGSTVTLVAVGTCTIQATQAGNSTYAAATPVSQSFQVTAAAPPELSLSSGGNINVTRGSASGNTSTITVTPKNGFTGGVKLSCSLSSSPAGASNQPTCSILSPVSITGPAAATTTLTVATTAPTSASLDHSLGESLFAGGGSILALVIFFGVPTRRRGWRALFSLVAVMITAFAMTACGSGVSGGSGGAGGGGGSGGGGGGQSNPGTTPGSYNFTVTATDTATGQITASVVVTAMVN